MQAARRLARATRSWRAVSGDAQLAYLRVAAPSQLAGTCAAAGPSQPGVRLLCSSARSPHEVLGIRPGALEAEIKKAYKALALKHHPDRNPDDREGAERRFKEVSAAYAALTGGSGGGGASAGGPGGGFGGGFPGGFSNEDAERLFREMMRGGGFPGGGGGGYGQQVQQEIFQGSDGRLRVRTTTVGPDGKRKVEEQEMGRNPFGGFGFGGPGGPGGPGFGARGPRREMTEAERRELEQAQRQAQEMMQRMAKEAARTVGAAVADAAKRRVKQAGLSLADRLLRGLTGRGLNGWRSGGGGGGDRPR